MFTIVVDQDLQLLLLESRHAQPLFNLVNGNRLSLREWLPWVDTTTTEEHVKQFIELGLQQFAGNKGFQCGLYYRGQLAGTIGLHTIDWPNKMTSIGYWLAPEFEGNGIMTRSCKALVHIAFTELGLNRLVIKAAVLNVKSRAIPERLGFSLESVTRQCQWLHDRYVDFAVYAMLAEEWKE